MSSDLPGTHSVKGKDGKYTTLCDRCGGIAYFPPCGCTEKERMQFASERIQKGLNLEAELRKLQRRANRHPGGRVSFDNLRK